MEINRRNLSNARRTPPLARVSLLLIYCAPYLLDKVYGASYIGYTMAIGHSSQRKTKRAGWTIIHQPLKPATVSRIDKIAKAESGVNPVSRTQMIRTLLELGLAQKEASL